MVVSRLFIMHRAVWAVIWVIGIGVMVRFFLILLFDMIV